jgi:hypothetical protein
VTAIVKINVPVALGVPEITPLQLFKLVGREIFGGMYFLVLILGGAW